MVSLPYRSKSARRLKARRSQKEYNLRTCKKPNNGLDRDIIAMKKVLQILHEGSVRWIGEVGRQY